jgi:flagellar motor protein MotB
VGRGEREPVAGNDDETGRQRNRRVEVAIYASSEMVQRARREAATE